MSDENDENNEKNPENNLNLELSLGLPQEQDPKEKQGQLVPQQNPVEEHGQSQFMQHYLRSIPPQYIQPSPPSEHHMTFPTDFTNMKTPWYVLAQAQQPFQPPPSLLEVTTSSLGQLLHPPQVNQFGTVASQPLAQAQQPFQPPPSLLEVTTSPSGQLLHPPQVNQVGTVASQPPRRGRPPARNGNQGRGNSSGAGAAVDRNVVEREIVPPYPWATKTPAVIHTLAHLLSNNINVISGQVFCRSCDMTQTLEYDLWEKFGEMSRYLKDNVEEMRQRASDIWMDSTLTMCGTCHSEMKPVICENKEEINWLFLFLGQMLGCCTLDQLRFFCESTSQHRTGAKDRVLYLTYLGLYKQLDPKAFS